MNIGYKLKSLRNNNQLTQAELAEKLGIKQSPISQIESGKIQPSLDLIIKIINYFNISFESLISEESLNNGSNQSNEVVHHSISSKLLPKNICSSCTEKERMIILQENTITDLRIQISDLLKDKEVFRDQIGELQTRLRNTENELKEYKKGNTGGYNPSKAHSA